MIDIKELIALLGVDGTKAGLDKSDMTNGELIERFGHFLPKNASKLKRVDIIDEIITNSRKETQKSIEELLQLSKEDLKEYFYSQKFERKELLDILGQLEISPGSNAKRNLTEFTISEVSDIGMFRRIAKGNHS